MPWSLKAQELLQEQYAAVGSASRTGLSAAQELLRQAEARGIDAGETWAEWMSGCACRTSTAMPMPGIVGRQRRWADIRLAPFHLLASEGAVHTDKGHLWHLDMADRLRRADEELFRETARKAVNLNSADEDDAIRWWEELTGAGGEGMGRQAVGVRRHRPARPGATGHEVPGPRVPAHHLRPGVHPARQLGTAA